MEPRKGGGSGGGTDHAAKVVIMLPPSLKPFKDSIPSSDAPSLLH